jgi:group I intron endonuclease
LELGWATGFDRLLGDPRVFVPQSPAVGRVLDGPLGPAHCSLAVLEGHLGLEGLAAGAVGAVEGSLVRLCPMKGMDEIQLPPLTHTTRQGGIYIVWLSDKHYYGGRAVEFRARWRRHLTKLEQGKHPNPYMQAVFNKHHRFSPEVLEIVPPDQQWHAEEKWLAKHFGHEGCLNLSRSPRNNTHLSVEARQKISAGNKGKKQSPEAIRRRVESRKGLKMSEEARKNNSKAQTGKVMSEEARQKMARSSFNRGKPISDGLRKAIIEANQRRKGEQRSSEVRTHLSEVVSGLVWMCCEECCRRVSPSEAGHLLEQGWQRGRKYKPC